MDKKGVAGGMPNVISRLILQVLMKFTLNPVTGFLRKRGRVVFTIHG